MTDRSQRPISSAPSGKFILLLALLLGSGILPLSAQRLSPLEPRPDWTKLDRYQETISREEFLDQLNTIYAPRNAWQETIIVGEDAAFIRESADPEKRYTLRFGESRPVPRYWRSPGEIPSSGSTQPLAGFRIAIDPGHLGGTWARMEERWFQIGDAPPVMEGDMTLLVARKLAARLQQQGASVELLRNDATPATADRPPALEKAAHLDLTERGVTNVTRGYDGSSDPRRFSSIRWLSEVLFYRASEIRARARLVNQKIRPDLTICLHFNAEAWGNPDAPTLTDVQHLHFLVNGCYNAGELLYDDIRFGMLEQLLNRTAPASISASDAAARSMADATGLPPYRYTGTNASLVGETGFVWARNLLANRLYLCPVIYAEPYVMNSRIDFARIQLGDYEGLQEVEGRLRPSIFEEYAESLHQGILNYFTSAHPSVSPSPRPPLTPLTPGTAP